MNRKRVVLLVILVTAWVGLRAEAEQTVVLRKAGSGSDCVCPKEGRWKVQNLEGWMNCTSPLNLKRTLEKVKDKGTIWILEKD